LKEQSRFFNEEKMRMEVEAARRFLAPATKQKVGDESREDKSEEAILDVQSVLVEEMESIVEKEAFEEAKLYVESETEEEMDGNKEKQANTEEVQFDVDHETEEEMYSNKEANSEEAKHYVRNKVEQEMDGSKEKEANSEDEHYVRNKVEQEMDGSKEKEANSEDFQVHVDNETEEEMHGNKRKGANSEEARPEVQNEENYGLDDDVSRKDSFYDTPSTEENDDKVARFLLPRANIELFLFIGVIVGLGVTWYLSKLQRKRTGLHKKLDVAASYRPVCLELSYC
jgi:hypothetical protein